MGETLVRTPLAASYGLRKDRQRRSKRNAIKSSVRTKVREREAEGDPWPCGTNIHIAVRSGGHSLKEGCVQHQFHCWSHAESQIAAKCKILFKYHVLRALMVKILVSVSWSLTSAASLATVCIFVKRFRKATNTLALVYMEGVQILQRLFTVKNQQVARQTKITWRDVWTKEFIP